MVQRFFRILFWTALVVCFVMAVIPAPIELGGSDKYQHIAAFATLTALALLGYRDVNALFLFAVVAAFGGMIEIVQGFSFVGRDADIADWVTDILSIVAVLGLWAIARSFLRGSSLRA